MRGNSKSNFARFSMFNSCLYSINHKYLMSMKGLISRNTFHMFLQLPENTLTFHSQNDATHWSSMMVLVPYLMLFTLKYKEC